MTALGAAGVLAARTALAEQDMAAAAQLPIDDAAGTVLLQHALRYRPDAADAMRSLTERLAVSNPHQALEMARRCVRADADDWRNWHALGLVEFQLGDAAGARQAMEREAALSRGFQAHFQLASLARVQGDSALFWEQMKIAWRIAPLTGSLFLLDETLSAANGNPWQIVNLSPADRPGMAARSVGFLLSSRDFYAAAVGVWNRLRCPPQAQAECQAMAVSLANHLAVAAFDLGGQHAAGWAAQAVQVWNDAVEHDGLAGARLSGGPHGLAFTPQWLGPAFAWSPPPLQYSALARDAKTPGYQLRVRFDGNQPDQLLLTRQLQPVQPGRYRLRLRAGSATDAQQVGLQVVIRFHDGPPAAVLPLSLGAKPGISEVSFQVPSGFPLAQVSLVYDRPNGSVRMSGIAWLGDIQMERLGR